MSVSQIVKSTQEQAVASWIDHLNQLRLDELVSSLFNQDVLLASNISEQDVIKVANIAAQDENLGAALRTLAELKVSVAALVESGRGGEKGVHGFIAERTQVAIENARKLIHGLNSEYVLLDNNGPIDYLKDGMPIQQKFYQNLAGKNNILIAIKGHLDKYPDFVSNGGKYQIPKDLYEAFEKYAIMPREEGNKLAGEAYKQFIAVQNFLKETGIDPNSIQDTVVTHSEVQREVINDTIANEHENIVKTDNNLRDEIENSDIESREEIKEDDRKRRDEIHEENKPSLQEGLKVTAISAGIEGGISFCLSVFEKLKSDKRISEFTAEDWQDVGIDTAAGGGKGAIRGASIYGLTNFTATPAAVASALVTATFGVVSQARLLHQGKITNEEFIINSEVVCLDVTVSAISSLVGQVMIPIPVLGAVVGNAAGMFMYGIAKNNLSQKEQALIASFNNDIKQMNGQLDARYLMIIDQLIQEFAKFKSVLDLAFDIDVNVAFAGSIALAQYVGCDNNKILWNKQAVDNYFQN